jgi:hypothetical protein
MISAKNTAKRIEAEVIAVRLRFRHKLRQASLK